MYQLLLTPGALLDFLAQIDELQEMNLDIEEISSNSFAVTIGNSVYTIKPDNPTEIPVEDVYVEDAMDANDAGYNAAVDSDRPENIESGVLKEMAKSLMLGGMIRLSTKLLK